MMKGLNIEATSMLAKNINIPVIASGGVSCIEDIKKINSVAKFGISGVIVGRALYEKKFGLSDAKKIINIKNDSN